MLCVGDAGVNELQDPSWGSTWLLGDPEAQRECPARVMQREHLTWEIKEDFLEEEEPELRQELGEQRTGVQGHG